MVDIRGFLPISLIEFPGRISSVVFTGGCNLRCPFCHNPGLVSVGAQNLVPKISEEELLKKIKEKSQWIDAVCFTGGEPTLNADLPDLFEKIKKIRGILSEPLEIMLETNGIKPEMIENLIARKLVDYIAMDVKAPFDDYKIKLGASDGMVEKIKKSVKIICDFGYRDASQCATTKERGVGAQYIDFLPLDKGEVRRGYEFRITIAPEIVTQENIGIIAQQVAAASKVILQQFRPIITLDPAWQKKQPYPDCEIKNMAEILRGAVDSVEIR
ncbi:MAG: anaerobic ribonucleoside-triphosphate reductase activating protein [bacterium]